MAAVVDSSIIPAEQLTYQGFGRRRSLLVLDIVVFYARKTFKTRQTSDSIYLTGAHIQTVYLPIMLHKTVRCTVVVTFVLYTLKLPDSNTLAGTFCLVWEF